MHIYLLYILSNFYPNNILLKINGQENHDSDTYFSYSHRREPVTFDGGRTPLIGLLRRSTYQKNRRPFGRPSSSMIIQFLQQFPRQEPLLQEQLPLRESQLRGSHPQARESQVLLREPLRLLPLHQPERRAAAHG